VALSDAAVSHQCGERLSAALTCRTRPRSAKVNPADTPILVLAVTSDTLAAHDRGCLCGPTFCCKRFRRYPASAWLAIAGEQKKRPSAIQVDPQALAARGLSLEDVRQRDQCRQRGSSERDSQQARARAIRSTPTTSCFKPELYDDLIIAYRNGSPGAGQGRREGDQRA